MTAILIIDSKPSLPNENKEFELWNFRGRFKKNAVGATLKSIKLNNDFLFKGVIDKKRLRPCEYSLSKNILYNLNYTEFNNVKDDLLNYESENYFKYTNKQESKFQMFEIGIFYFKNMQSLQSSLSIIVDQYLTHVSPQVSYLFLDLDEREKKLFNIQQTQNQTDNIKWSKYGVWVLSLGHLSTLFFGNGILLEIPKIYYIVPLFYLVFFIGNHWELCLKFFKKWYNILFR